MKTTDSKRRGRRGFLQVLLRLPDEDPPRCIEEIDWKEDYCPVLTPFPWSEFESPHHLLNQLHEDPDRYGRLPRPIQRFDLINLWIPRGGAYGSVPRVVVDPTLDHNLIPLCGCDELSQTMPWKLTTLSTSIPLFPLKTPA